MPAGRPNASTDGHTDLYECAPFAYFIVTREALISDANLAAACLLGIAQGELVGRSLLSFATPDSRTQLHAFWDQLFSRHGQHVVEAAFVDANEQVLYVHIAATADHRLRTGKVAMVDISARKKAESALIESEQQLRDMIDSLPVLMWTSDRNGACSWVNKGWLDFTGHALAEEVGNGWRQSVHPDDLQKYVDTHAAASLARQPFSLEYRLRNRNGKYCHVLAKASPRLSPAGEFLGFIGSCTDISERKNIEESLEHSHRMLRHLVSYQERVREDERKRIAREIHDDLGQNLLALRIDVAMLESRTAGTHPRLNEKVKIALGHIDATMKAVRAAINNLRPTVLDLGLNAAIEWQVREFQRRSGISCELHMDDKDFHLDDTRATALFRILQESLNNVIRHAQASHVDIELHREGNELYMKVADNGVGIYPSCRRKANAFGLIGIEERVNALGGRLHIESDPDMGTTLSVSILPSETH